MCFMRSGDLLSHFYTEAANSMDKLVIDSEVKLYNTVGSPSSLCVGFEPLVNAYIVRLRGISHIQFSVVQ